MRLCLACGRKLPSRPPRTAGRPRIYCESCAAERETDRLAARYRAMQAKKNPAGDERRVFPMAEPA